MQPTIANLSCLHDVGTEIVSESAAATVNFHPITWCKRVDPAEFEYSLRAIIESAKDCEQIWDDDFVTLANCLNDLAARKATVDIAEPPLQHFDANPKRQNVEAANFNPLPPTRR